jgi:hypothetical protein
MRYLKKSPHSQVISNELQYPKDSRSIRDELLKEQRGFCAYSERYVQNTDARDVEHFDARLKGTENDIAMDRQLRTMINSQNMLL